MSRKRIYIAGPISKGDLAHNINQASKAFRTLADAGFAPFCPHWSVYSGVDAAQLYEQRDDSGYSIVAEDGEAITDVMAKASAQGNGMSHADWLAVDLAWVAVSDAVLRLPGESTGADIEMAEALRLGIPVFTSIPDLLGTAWAFGTGDGY